jgi:cytochrome c oxidase assembly factor CtaG
MPGMNMTATLPRLTWGRAFTMWSLHSPAAAVITVLLVMYLIGVQRARQRQASWHTSRTVAWCAGVAVLVVATQGSVAVYGDALFSMHMGAHLMLIMVAPVLLLLGHPLDLAIAASAPQRRDRVRALFQSRAFSLLTHPVVGLVLYGAVIAGTHLTNFMDTMMTHAWLPGAEQLTYVTVGLIFFLPLVSDQPIRWQLTPPLRMAMFVVAMPVDTFTGVILSQTTRYPWPAMAAMHPAWAPSLITDLHAGGAVMWVGGDAIMAVLFGVAAVAWARNAATGDGSELGGWLSAARVNYQADIAPASVTRSVETGDSDDDHNAYNAYLARLAQRGDSTDP